MNYYSSHFLKAWDGESQVINNSTGEKGTSVFTLKGVGARVSNPAVPTTDWDWPIYPQGMHDQLVRVHRDYPTCKEIFIAENGMGYKDDFVDGKVDDTPRIEYVAKHLAAVHAAIAEGVPVKGYYIWSLQDMLSWSNGYNKRYGLFYVDYKTQQRYPKKSAYWYRLCSERHAIVPLEEVVY